MRSGIRGKAKMLQNQEERLRKAAEQDDDGTFEDYKQKAHEKYEELQNEESIGSYMGEEELMTLAINDVTSQDYKFQRTPDSEEIPILAIGHQGIQTWGAGTEDEREVLIAHGITLDPSQEEEGSPPPIGPASFIIEEEDVEDLYEVESLFRPMNTLKGVFSINDSDVANAYVCNSQRGDTEVYEADIDDIPTEPSDIREIYHQQLDEVKLRNIADNLSAYDTNDDGSRGRAIDFGVDLKWMEGKVIDKYIRRESDCEPGQNPFAVYTLLDTEVVDESELEGTNVIEEGGLDGGQTLGLTAWVPEPMADFAEGSMGEFYGTTSFNEEGGKVEMNVTGFVPFRKKPIQDASAADDDVEEETI